MANSIALPADNNWQTRPDNHPAKLDYDDEADDYVEYLGRQAQAWSDNPPPAPPGFVLLPCDATPRHWPLYTVADDDFYDAPCLYCQSEPTYAAHALCDHSHHRAWRRWKISHKIVGQLYVSGISVTGGGWKWGGGCNGCLSGKLRFRGKRPYILWVQRDTWHCLLRRHHRPTVDQSFGLCTKCLPCATCGSTALGHYCEPV